MDIKQINEALDKLLEDFDSPNEDTPLYNRFVEIVKQLGKLSPEFEDSLEIRSTVDEDDYYIDATLIIDDYEDTYDHELVDKNLFKLEGFAEIKGTHGLRYLTLDLDEKSTEDDIKMVANSLNNAQEIVDKYYKG